MEAAMNFSSSTLDGELIVLRLPQEQKMFQSSRHRLFHEFFISIMHDLQSHLFKASIAQKVYMDTGLQYSVAILENNHNPRIDIILRCMFFNFFQTSCRLAY